MVAALSLASVAPAALAVDRFVFHGAGLGHGIGMSQYGAFGLSLKGWSGQRIVRYYYTGVRVTQRQAPKDQYRVGLLQDRTAVSFEAAEGGYSLRLADGTLIEEVPQGASRKVRVTADQTFVVKNGSETVGGQEWGGPENPLRVRYESAVVRVPEWGYSVGRGFLELVAAAPNGGHLVVVVPAEPYLYGLGEVPSSWPTGALEAQAIAARTYAYRIVGASSKEGCACDILGDTRDQNYTGWDKETAEGGGRWVKAVDRTDRKVALYRGDPITAYYSSSSGGFTENVENVWGGSPEPYLKGKCDPGDFTVANPNRVWTQELSATQIADRLSNPEGMERATKIEVLDRGVSGRIVTARIVGRTRNGTVVAVQRDGWSLRGDLDLGDSRVWINANRNVTGDIRARYDRMRCRPGLATTNQKTISAGRWQGFDGGRLYENRDADRVFWLHGAVLDTYVERGAHTSGLRLPTSDVKRVQGGGTRATFQGGTITCPASGPCRVT